MHSELLPEKKAQIAQTSHSETGEHPSGEMIRKTYAEELALIQERRAAERRAQKTACRELNFARMYLDDRFPDVRDNIEMAKFSPEEIARYAREAKVSLRKELILWAFAFLVCVGLFAGSFMVPSGGLNVLWAFIMVVGGAVGGIISVGLWACVLKILLTGKLGPQGKH